MLNKFGETFTIGASNVHSMESVFADAEINSRFSKFAAELKRIAPKAKDFVYFSAILITSAEATSLDTEGKCKLTKNAEPVKVSWDISPNGSWKWVTNDPSIQPYSNANGDIFPEQEVLKAYKMWIGKPLCVDHKSDQVDAIRGIILDTYYDRQHKRVVAMCALDKVSYPELARGVQSGYKTCVSMGTRVAKAICMACGTAASTERDFCNHMRTKTSGGEINVGLDPIELSIVVNGADPQAKILTILAAANNLRSSLDSKAQEISKLSMSPSSIEKFKELEDDLKKMADKLADLKSTLGDDTNQVSDAPYGQSGDYANQISEFPQDKEKFEIPDRLATHNSALTADDGEKAVKDSITAKFQEIEENLTILSHRIKEELIMSVNSNRDVNKVGYFQGAGGANEPAPHQVKYPIDPMNETLRNSGDKQMSGQHNMDTGPVDGMSPGPESAGISEEKRKELLQRAQVDERGARRVAALNKAKENLMKSKEAYFQGGGDVNEPTPGKVKYPVDKLNEVSRDKEDKQMQGAKPFPDVGSVDGLYGDDLKKKELLQRASIKARFVRVANEDGSQNLAESGWEVSKDGDVLFTATVDEISGGNVEGLYDVVATREFGTKLLERVNKFGAAKAKSLYKGAQDMGPNPSMGAEPTPPPGNEAMVPSGLDSAPPPGMPTGSHDELDLNKDPNAKGDPKTVAVELAEKAQEQQGEVSTTISDLSEAVKALAGEPAEMGELDELTAKSSVSPDFKKMVSMKKKLHASLISGLKTALADLNAQSEELGLVSDVLSGTSADAGTNALAEQSLSDGAEILDNAMACMASFVDYVEGSEQLSKHAQAFADESFADDDKKMEEDKEEDKEEDENKVDMPSDDGLDLELALHDKNDEEPDMNEVMMDVDPAMLQGKKVEVKASLDLSTKEARAEARMKLAAKAVQFSPMLGAAHGKLLDGPNFGAVKPEGNLGHVETIEEKHQAILDVAQAPVKVRKEAARLNQLIVEGKVKSSDLDGLVSQGLDAEVVKYWKQFWGQAGKEGSEFASELLKEHAKAQLDETMATHKVKIARAYELANEMVRRGLITDERSAITAQVDDIMTYNDEGFEAMKRMVNKTQLRRTASAMPQVGLIDSGNSAAPSMSLQDELDQAWGNRRF